MNKEVLFGIIIIYLIVIFYLAFWAENVKKSKWTNHPIIYTLSLAVYCTAWTYYGSVGLAANRNIEFLPIYLGPVIAVPLWIVLGRKIVYLTKTYNISSIADFISLRYGNNRSLGAITTLVCLTAIIPYLSLQLKAVSESFQILVKEEFTHTFLFKDYTFYITVILGVFAAFFGTLSSDATNRKKGIVFTVAIESLIKLIIITAIGLYVVFYLFNGTTDIYNQIAAQQSSKVTYEFGLESGLNWMMLITSSFMAIFLLPRQFQMSVVEYVDRFQMKFAIWGFPLYLLLFNLFVIFIAWAGILMLGENVNQDYYTLLIPMSQGHDFLASMVFLGGFSAVMSMMVVSSIALATMTSNNLIIPYGFLDYFSKRFSVQNEKTIKNIRRITIFLLILISYFLYINWQIELSLISIGLISFVIIAQLAPAFFIGLYWNRASSLGAKYGILAGFVTVALLLIIPFSQETIFGSNSLATQGYFGIKSLMPYQLFGINFLSPVNHAFFWSLMVNLFTYLVLSVLFKGNYRERNYGEIFVNTSEIASLQDNSFVWQGEAYYSDIQEVLIRFLGNEKALRAIDIFKRKYHIPAEEDVADARLINFSEKLLTGTIGSASAKILIGTVVKETPVSITEVLNILEENKETKNVNKQLTHQSEQLIKLTHELKNANEELRTLDQQKDSFLDTIAHELKTPITAIQASSEVLQDQEMPEGLREKFLENIISDTERLTKLINQILNLEKIASGREVFNIKENNLTSTIQNSIESLQSLANKKGTQIHFDSKTKINLRYDEDKLIQVITNLLGNALKFIPDENGKIKVEVNHLNDSVSITITDNGRGINPEDLPYIFDKFYQSKHQHLIKPTGSGMGLAISKKIIEMHQGSLTAKNNEPNGATFTIEIPKL